MKFVIVAMTVAVALVIMEVVGVFEVLDGLINRNHKRKER